MLSILVSKISPIACTAASQPARCPAHSWRQPAASIISCLTTNNAAFAMILLEVSPLPIGLTPGFLSRAGHSDQPTIKERLQSIWIDE